MLNDISRKERVAVIGSAGVSSTQYIKTLVDEGFDVDVYRSGVTVIRAFDEAAPELALLVVGSGSEKESAFRLCRELRVRSPQLPIILVASDDEEPDRISGYRVGADDYLSRQSSPVFVAVRIRSLLERIAALKSPMMAADRKGILRCGALAIDRDTMAMSWSGVPVSLTLTQYWIVLALVEAAGNVKSLAELMDAANANVHPNTITANIARIRRQFKEADGEFDAIENVHGHGYRWVHPALGTR